MRLAGKVAVIAGAGGAMGTAVPAAFAREGARLVLVARRREPLEALAEQLRAHTPDVEVAVATADLPTAAGAAAAAIAALDRFGRVDVLYNNLGDAASG